MLRGEKPVDNRLGSVVGALADMAVADNSFFVYENDGRPCPHAKAFPDMQAVILHHGKFYPQPLCRVLYFVDRFFPWKLW